MRQTSPNFNWKAARSYAAVYNRIFKSVYSIMCTVSEFQAAFFRAVLEDTITQLHVIGKYCVLPIFECTIL